jgi:RNA recognition motif-containing protein
MAEESGRPNATIYVGGLDTHLVTVATLSEAFVPFGEISDITLPKPEAPSSTDLHRGFGYVEFEDAADAKEAIDNMDQSELYGRVIKVAMAKPDRKETGESGLGSMTAIWEQVRATPALLRVLTTLLIFLQEGYLAKYTTAANEDRAAVEQSRVEKPEDPMQGLEGLDVAGPKPE